MAELQPPEVHINGCGGALALGSTENVGTKRQRRPSVRLGDIGDQPYETTHHLNRRATKQWKLLPVTDSSSAGGGGGKVSFKTRVVVNLPNSENYYETLDGDDKDANLDSAAIGSWKIRDFKSKRGSTKRVRSDWVSSKLDEGVGGGAAAASEADDKFSGGEDVDDGYRGFEPEGSESPVKDNSPINSIDNVDMDLNRGYLRRRGNSGGVRASRDHHDGVELDGPSDTDCRNWNNPENGVRVWLNQLGLGRYAPVFEIHEVDDEVLPMLTLEDLKDMGINAVGSRRKMYCSIQKLGKGFS